MKNLKIGILKETKTPPDRRVVLAPNEALEFTKQFPNIELVVQSSKIRCYKDDEYKALGISVVDDVSDCDFLIGVKEVDIPALINDKTYLFFSHTAKKQAYNRPLLQACIDKNITLLDHEYLTNQKGERLVAFGRYAGIVGAYNSFIAYGRRTGLFQLKRAHDCKDINEMNDLIAALKLPAIKIVITGGGRVAHGAMEILDHMKIEKVDVQDFNSKEYDHPVYCQANPEHYVGHSTEKDFNWDTFINHPEEYHSTFKALSQNADMWIACHFWDHRSPKFLETEDMVDPAFRLKIIADVSCDIAGPIPSTIRPSTIAEPFYGYNPFSKSEDDPWKQSIISVTAVDNLPGEVPRDASEHFGQALLKYVFPSIFHDDEEGVMKRATITKEGQLTEHFQYLQDFLLGKE